MRSTQIFFSGWILITLLKKHHTASPECRKSQIDDLLITNCSGIDLYVNHYGDVFPPLDPKTDVLYFSNLTLVAISAANFSHFKHLRKLHLLNTQISSLNETTFTHQKYLTHLNLSGSRWSSTVDLTLPKYLKILNINNCWRPRISATDCPFLEELHAGDNLCPTFPLINYDAPLVYLNLDNNKQINVKAEDLAPFCVLKYLGLAFDIEIPQNYCQCMRLHEWARRYEIQTTYAQCQTEESPKPQCDLTFSSEALSMREKCLKRNKFNLTYILLAAIGGLIAILIVTVCVIFIKRKMTAASNEADEDEN